MATNDPLEIAQAAVRAAQAELRGWLHDEACDYDEDRPEETCTCGLALVRLNLSQASQALQELLKGNGHDSTHR